MLVGDLSCGKTTVINNLRKHLGDHQGLFSRPVFIHNCVAGFRLQDQNDHVLGIFAHVDFTHKPHYDKYGIDLSVFNEQGAAFLERLPRATPWLIVDEIGIMEQFASAYLQALYKVLAGPIPVLAVVQSRARYFLEKCETFYRCHMYHINEHNRDEIIQKLEKILKNV